MVCLVMPVMIFLTACGGETYNPSFATNARALMHNTTIDNMEDIQGFGVSASGMQGMSTEMSLASSTGRNTLVRLDDDGQIREVVFASQEAENSQVITQEQVGHLVNVSTYGDFTFMEFANSARNECLSRYTFFASADRQTFIIYHPTGNVYAMQDFRPGQFILASFRDGIFSFDGNFYKLYVYQNNLHFSHLNTNPQIDVHSAILDFYGNAIILTRNTNLVTQDAKFIVSDFSTHPSILIGDDNRVYRFYPGYNTTNPNARIQVLNENRVWVDTPISINTPLRAIWQNNRASTFVRTANTLQLVHISGGRADVFIIDEHVLSFSQGGLHHTFHDGNSIITERVLDVSTAFWFDGRLIVGIIGATQTNQYSVSFDGVDVTKTYFQTLTFQGNPLVVIHPIN